MIDGLSTHIVATTGKIKLVKYRILFQNKGGRFPGAWRAICEKIGKYTIRYATGIIHNAHKNVVVLLYHPTSASPARRDRNNTSN
jgi:hypothetical protein